MCLYGNMKNLFVCSVHCNMRVQLVTELSLHLLKITLCADRQAADRQVEHMAVCLLRGNRIYLEEVRLVFFMTLLLIVRRVDAAESIKFS